MLSHVQGISTDAIVNLIVVGGMACNISNASLQDDVDVARQLTAVETPPTMWTDTTKTCVHVAV